MISRLRHSGEDAGDAPNSQPNGFARGERPRRTRLKPARDFVFVFGEVAGDHGEVKMRQDRFFRLAFQEKFKRAPHQLFRRGFSGGEPLEILQLQRDAMHGFARALNHANAKVALGQRFNFDSRFRGESIQLLLW